MSCDEYEIRFFVWDAVNGKSPFLTSFGRVWVFEKTRSLIEEYFTSAFRITYFLKTI